MEWWVATGLQALIILIGQYGSFRIGRRDGFISGIRAATENAVHRDDIFNDIVEARRRLASVRDFKQLTKDN